MSQTENFITHVRENEGPLEEIFPDIFEGIFVNKERVLEYNVTRIEVIGNKVIITDLYLNDEFDKIAEIELTTLKSILIKTISVH